MSYKNVIKKLTLFFFSILYTCGLFPKDIKNKVSILIFHHIYDKNKFKALINTLNKNYHFITPTEFKLFLKNKFTPPKNSLLLTFDDGFKCQFDITQECLNPLNIKALFFIPSAFVNTSNEDAMGFINNNMRVSNYPTTPLSDPISMTWKHIQTLISQDHHIGAHTASHIRLNKDLTEKQVAVELKEPKALFKEKLNIELKDFAIPFGNIQSITAKNLHLIKQFYPNIYCSIRGFCNPNSSIIFRENLDMQDPIKTQDAMIKGCYHWIYKNKRKKLNRWL